MELQYIRTYRSFRVNYLQKTIMDAWDRAHPDIDELRGETTAERRIVAIAAKHAKAIQILYNFPVTSAGRTRGVTDRIEFHMLNLPHPILANVAFSKAVVKELHSRIVGLHYNPSDWIVTTALDSFPKVTGVHILDTHAIVEYKTVLENGVVISRNLKLKYSKGEK